LDFRFCPVAALQVLIGSDIFRQIESQLLQLIDRARRDAISRHISITADNKTLPNMMFMI